MSHRLIHINQLVIVGVSAENTAECLIEIILKNLR